MLRSLGLAKARLAGLLAASIASAGCWGPDEELVFAPPPPAVAPPPHRDRDRAPRPERSSMIDSDDAERIAREALSGRLALQADSPVTIERRKGRYIVTFLKVEPSGAFGEGYEARVVVDARSGDVKDVRPTP